MRTTRQQRFTGADKYLQFHPHSRSHLWAIKISASEAKLDDRPNVHPGKIFSMHDTFACFVHKAAFCSELAGGWKRTQILY